MEFLQAWGWDLIDAFFCFNCRRLHTLFPSYQSKWEFRSKDPFCRLANRSCQTAEDKTLGITLFCIYPSEFKFEHIQMAAKLHQQPCSSPKAKAYLERLSFVNRPLAHLMGFWPYIKGLHLFEPQPLGNQVCARVQSWSCIPEQVNMRFGTIF